MAINYASIRYKSLYDTYKKSENLKNINIYNTIEDLPLTGIESGNRAYIISSNALYIYMDSGWYKTLTGDE